MKNQESETRKELLKHMILELHKGEAPELVKKRLVELLKNIPYNDVVEVEQELISEGLPEEEVLKFCDIHTMVLDGHIDQTGAKEIPEGHPVDTFKNENRELEKEIASLEAAFEKVKFMTANNTREAMLRMRATFNNLMDVEKHYSKKENLLFPFLERYGITGPPKVMWGKHDEVRQMLKAALSTLSVDGEVTPGELGLTIEIVLRPALKGISDMIMKEEEILFPMCMDTLKEEDWYQIYLQTPKIGFCLYDPQVEWKPASIEVSSSLRTTASSVMLSTGMLKVEELEAILSIMPIDITFVDKDDKVKFFSNAPERVFTRTRAVLGRDVRLCHPPGSVHIVEKILNDFRQGRENSAAFWINFQGKFIYIEYFAVRDKEGNYLGTLEYTQDATTIRGLEGEQRLLSYK